MKKSLLIFLSIILTGCASYRAATLQDYSPVTFVNVTESKNNSLLVAAKKLDETDCKNYLDRNVIRAGYQPIQLFIKNNSDKTYDFSPRRINLPCANYDQVASRVHTSTIGRVAGYGIGALIIFPLVIPAVIDGIKSSEANQALDLDFSLKTARDELIHPGFSLNKLLFIPRESYRSPLIFNLMEIESKSLEEFEVHTN